MHFVRMLLHLVQPTAGQALVFGGRYQDLERPASRVGAVLEAADFASFHVERGSIRDA